MTLLPKLVDDRGRPVTGQGRPTRADALAAGVDKATVESAIGHPVRDAALYGGLMGLSFGGVPSLGFALLSVLPAVLAWPLIVAIVACIVLLAFRLVRGARKHLKPSGWLSMGLCPGCAYRLTDIEPEEDECRVCPECGGAWKMEDATHGP